MKYIASCSFGKDSLCMVLKLIELNYPLDEVIFFDTGMEFQAIYNNRDRIKLLLKEHNIKFTELKHKDNFLYNMFIRPVKYRNPKEYPYHYGYEWCGARGVRWGTSYKTTTINKYYKETYRDEEIREYVGIAVDERERAKEDANKLYPLIEWNMTEKDCLEYCYAKGFNWLEEGIDLYSIFDRVSCWCCANSNLKELKNMYRYLPSYWQKLRGIQSRINTPMKGEGKNVFELEERFKEEIRKEKHLS